MATANDLNISGWTVQSSTPLRDGSFPASVRTESSSYAPSATARIIYVDSTLGNDGTGAPTNLAAQPDPFIPDGNELPYQSISAASSQLRSGEGDWILFKRGESFAGSLGLAASTDGSSAVLPTLIGYYGSTGDRPVISNGAGTVANVTSGSANYITFYGLKIYCAERDPDNVGFVLGNESSGAYGIRYVGSGGGSDIVVDDCDISYFKDGIVIQTTGTAYQNITVKNSIIHDQLYDLSSGYSSGIFLSGVEGSIRVNDNFWYHNGWHENGSLSGCHRHQYNHNVYFQHNNNGADADFKRNVSLEGASHGCQGRMGGTYEDNLYARCAVGYSKAGVDVPFDNGVTGISLKQVIIEGMRMDATDPQNAGTTTAVYGVYIVGYTEDNGGEAVVQDTIVANRLESGTNVGITQQGFATYTNNIVFNWNATEDAPDTFTDASRNVDSYMVSEGLGTTYDDFVSWHLARPTGTTHGLYSAPNVNDYIREGFDLVVS